MLYFKEVNNLFVVVAKAKTTRRINGRDKLGTIRFWKEKTALGGFAGSGDALGLIAIDKHDRLVVTQHHRKEHPVAAHVRVYRDLERSATLVGQYQI